MGSAEVHLVFSLDQYSGRLIYRSPCVLLFLHPKFFVDVVLSSYKSFLCVERLAVTSLCADGES